MKIPITKSLYALGMLSTLMGSSFVLADNITRATAHYIVIGGAEQGADSLDRTSSEFDLEIAPVLAFLASAPNYERHFIFGRPYPYYLQSFPQFFSKERVDATSINMKSIVTIYENRIENGDIRSGDKIIIHIIDHGALPGTGQLAHSIATVDANGGLFSLDELKSLADQAVSHGVLLALIDDSCFSGSSLSLSNANTCVVTGSTSDTPSYLSYVSNLTASLAPGKSVEDVYLSARQNWRYDEALWKKFSFSPAPSGLMPIDGLPQISSPAGLFVQRELTPLDYYVAHDDPDLPIEDVFYHGLEKYGPTSSLLVLPDLSSFFAEASRFLPQQQLTSLQSKTENFKLVYQPAATTWLQEHSLQQDVTTEMLSNADPDQILASPQFAQLKKLRQSFAEQKGAFKADYSWTFISNAEKTLYLNFYRAFQLTAQQPNPCRDLRL